MDNLPYELIQSIITRDECLKYMLVCRSWHRLITSCRYYRRLRKYHILQNELGVKTLIVDHNRIQILQKNIRKSLFLIKGVHDVKVLFVYTRQIIKIYCALSGIYFEIKCYKYIENITEIMIVLRKGIIVPFSHRVIGKWSARELHDRLEPCYKLDKKLPGVIETSEKILISMIENGYI